MRIVMVSASFPGSTRPAGGESLHVLSLTEALIERGHQIALLTRRGPSAAEPIPGTDVTFSTRPVVPHLLNKVLQVDPFVYVSVLRALRTWGPEIVHLHAFLDLSFAPIAAAARLRIPVAATVHSYWPVCLRHRLAYNEDRSCVQRYVREICAPCLAYGLRVQMGVRVPVPLVSLVLRGTWRARRHALRTVARFIAPSAATARSLRESGFPSERITVLNHGLPQRDFAVRPRRPQRVTGEIHLLCVGRLKHGKGVQDLLEALDRVRQAHPNLILTVAGDGPFRSVLERLCASKGLASSVRFIGEQPRSRLPELYAEADLVVIPSLSEVFPYVAMEAAAAGAPVVATTVGGIPEILGDGAILVPPMNPPALAQGILTALSDREAAGARAARARDRYLTHFVFEPMVDRTEALYAELLSSRVMQTQPALTPRRVTSRPGNSVTNERS